MEMHYEIGENENSISIRDMFPVTCERLSPNINSHNVHGDDGDRVTPASTQKENDICRVRAAKGSSWDTVLRIGSLSHEIGESGGSHKLN